MKRKNYNWYLDIDHSHYICTLCGYVFQDLFSQHHRLGRNRFVSISSFLLFSHDNFCNIRDRVAISKLMSEETALGNYSNAKKFFTNPYVFPL